MRSVSGSVSIAASTALLVVCASAPSAWSQGTAATVQKRVQEASSAAAAPGASAVKLSETDLLTANIWGLTQSEMVRAKVLLQGPRKAFSVENLSPIEALGIHARDEAERRKYAEMFARAFHADVERSLAWNRAFSDAMGRLYPNEPVVDFSQLPKVQTSVGAADTLNVPRSSIAEKPGSGYTPLPPRRGR